jgi:hypothetical protein
VLLRLRFGPSELRRSHPLRRLRSLRTAVRPVRPPFNPHRLRSGFAQVVLSKVIRRPNALPRPDSVAPDHFRSSLRTSRALAGRKGISHQESSKAINNKTSDQTCSSLDRGGPRSHSPHQACSPALVRQFPRTSFLLVAAADASTGTCPMHHQASDSSMFLARRRGFMVTHSWGKLNSLVRARTSWRFSPLVRTATRM